MSNNGYDRLVPTIVPSLNVPACDCATTFPSLPAGALLYGVLGLFGKARVEEVELVVFLWMHA
jgi:hypothetical protein